MISGHATGRSEIWACNHESKDNFGITSYRLPGGSSRQRCAAWHLERAGKVCVVVYWGSADRR